MSVLAGMILIVDFIAVRTVKYMTTTSRGATLHNVIQRPTVARQDVGSVCGEIVGSVLLDNFC
jgi:hypothetical protein